MGAQSSPKDNHRSLQFGAKPYVVLNGTVYFSGNCEECRPYCGVLCCRAYRFVSLTKEEAKSGRYAFRKVSDGCDCETCKRMRELEIKYTLPKQPDGSCIYLDGTRNCSIYEDRPETCKQYTCADIPFVLSP